MQPILLLLSPDQGEPLMMPGQADRSGKWLPLAACLWKKPLMAVLLNGWLAVGIAVCDEVETLAPPLPPPAAPADIGYALGYRIGRQLRADLESIDLNADPTGLIAGLREALDGREPSLPEERFGRGLASFDARITARDEAFRREFAGKAEQNQKQGQAFLAAQRRQPGVRELPGGVLIEVRKRGRGPSPTLADEVLVHYTGRRIDGEVFDATDPADEPARIRLKDVIPGWQQAIVQMPTGSRWQIVLPAAQAYGEEGAPPVIEPNEVLVFEIELVAISPRP